MTITSAYCEVHQPGRVAINPGSRELPRRSRRRDARAPRSLRARRAQSCTRRLHPGRRPLQGADIKRVYAAGDATDFAIKLGGIAAQQADVTDDPEPFHPVIHGILLTRGKPRYLSAHVTGGHGSSSQITQEPTWSPATKIMPRYLAPYLEEHDRLEGSNG
jgi:hypothetical protein